VWELRRARVIVCELRDGRDGLASVKRERSVADGRVPRDTRRAESLPLSTVIAGG